MSSILLSFMVIATMRALITADQLFYIRTQQVFGTLTMMYWFVALSISPLGYVFGKERLEKLAFARRAIGVSAAYFACLHAAIALWGQLGGPARLGQLPDFFIGSLTAGAVGLVILILMASTSFDKVIKFMTFRRWKWLHRLGYLGFTLVLIHIWTVGTHLSYGYVQIIAVFLLGTLAALESNRLVRIWNQKWKLLSPTEAFATTMSLWIVLLGLIFAIPILFDNYHAAHHNVEPAVEEVYR